MKNLLFLTDFSANATYAAEYGYQLARRLRANIVLCNVINALAEIPQADFVAWPMEGEDILKNFSDMELKDLKIHLENKASAGFNPLVKSINYTGTVEEVIINTVGRYEIDMIVMGTHQDAGLRGFLLGNHNQSMISQTTIPLLLVPPVAPKEKINRIAFATDLKHVDDDLECIYSLVKFAKLMNAEILITHILDGKQQLPLSEQQREKLLTEISNKVDYPRIYYKSLINNSAEAGLVWLCIHENISVLAILPRKRNFMESLISSSLTKKIIKHLSIPILVFPAK